jgi:hypothetical protein
MMQVLMCILHLFWSHLCLSSLLVVGCYAFEVTCERFPGEGSNEGSDEESDEEMMVAMAWFTSQQHEKSGRHLASRVSPNGAF